MATSTTIDYSTSSEGSVAKQLANVSTEVTTASDSLTTELYSVAGSVRHDFDYATAYSTSLEGSVATQLANVSTEVTTASDSLTTELYSVAGSVRHDFDYATARELHSNLFLYLGIFLLLVGVCGNILAICVLQTPHFRKFASSFLLSALAVMDTGVLLTALLRQWILAYSKDDWDLRSRSKSACSAHFFFAHYFFQMSAWTLVLVTAERLIAVIRPLQARSICNRKRAIVIWVVMAVAVFGINAHLFVTVSLSPLSTSNWSLHCIRNKLKYRALWGVWNWVDSTLAVFIPGLAILIMNVIIAAKVFLAKRDRRKSVRSPNRDTKSTSHVTSMLLGISALFLVTNLPMAIYLLGENLWPQQTPLDRYNTGVAHSVVSIAQYINFSANFLLYCVCGRAKFRRTLCDVLRCRVRQRGVSSSRYTHSTTLAGYSVKSVAYNRSLSTISYNRSMSVTNNV